jgi:DNA-binding transcriptional LysR family regulator
MDFQHLSHFELRQICYFMAVISINNSIANSILPDVLQHFRCQFPNVELVLREVTIQQEIQMLKTHQLDVIFQRSPYLSQDDPNLDFLPILEEYFVVALPEAHPLARQTQISLKALANDSIILPPLDVLPFYEKVIILCKESGFEPKVLPTTVVTGVVTLLSLVAAGIGVSILPNHVQTLHREGVVYRPIHDAKLTRQVAVVWRQNDSSIVLRNFLNTVQNSLVDSW